jgi:hypothetical protein
VFEGGIGPPGEAGMILLDPAGVPTHLDLRHDAHGGEGEGDRQHGQDHPHRNHRLPRRGKGGGRILRISV